MWWSKLLDLQYFIQSSSCYFQPHHFSSSVCSWNIEIDVHFFLLMMKYFHLVFVSVHTSQRNSLLFTSAHNFAWILYAQYASQGRLGSVGVWVEPWHVVLIANKDIRMHTRSKNTLKITTRTGLSQVQTQVRLLESTFWKGLVSTQLLEGQLSVSYQVKQFS